MTGNPLFPAAETGLALRRTPALPGAAGPWPVLPAPRPEPLPQKLPVPLPETGERPCPVPRLMRRTGLGLLLSTVTHAGMAAAALIFLPASSSDHAERGGSPAVMAVTLVGETEALATVEGARAEPVSLALPDPLAIDSVVIETSPPVPMPALPPVPEPVIDVPRPPLPAAAPAPDPPSRAKPVTMPRQKQSEPSRARPVQGPGQDREKIGIQATTRQASARAGTRGTAPTAGSAVLVSYGARLRALIERQKSYPDSARERGQTGRTTIALVIARDGRLASVSVAKGSGHAVLDAATLAAVRRAQPFPALPEGGPPSVSFQLSVGYELH